MHLLSHCFSCGQTRPQTAGKVATLDVLDEFRDVDVDGASGDALRVGTVEATGSLTHGLFGTDALVHLFVAGDAVGGVELRHLNALNRSALLRSLAIAQFHSPLLIASSIDIVVFHFDNSIKKMKEKMKSYCAPRRRIMSSSKSIW